MPESVTVTKVDSPSGKRVRHFDELDETEQTMLAAVASGSTQCGQATTLTRGDVVVFTDYYEVVGC
jgi:hypothetical protein